MWMRCNFCPRTLLVLDRQIPSPFFCDECRRRESGFVARFADRMIGGPTLAVADLPSVVVGADVVIDITPTEE